MKAQSTKIMPCLPQIAPCFLAVRIIEAQQRCGGARYVRQRNDASTFGAKVVPPHIRPWIEQAHNLFCFRIHRGDIGPFEAIALNTRQRKVFEVGFSAMLRGNDVIWFVKEESTCLRHQAVFTAFTSPFPNGGSERSREMRLAHALPDCCAKTSALISETKRSTSQISSSSASSTAVRAPSWLRRRSSCARAAALGDGRNLMISLAAGRRARNEITSRRRPELRVQVRLNPRAIISATRSRSGSNCCASCSGISMVTCMIYRLRQSLRPVKLRILPFALRNPFAIRHSSFVIPPGHAPHH